MLDISRSFFWFALGIALLIIAGYGGYVLYQLAKTIQESKRILKNVNEKLAKIDPIFEAIVSATTPVIAGIQALAEIVKPAAAIPKLIKSIRDLISAFHKKKSEKTKK